MKYVLYCKEDNDYLADISNGYTYTSDREVARRFDTSFEARMYARSVGWIVSYLPIPYLPMRVEPFKFLE